MSKHNKRQERQQQPEQPGVQDKPDERTHSTTPENDLHPAESVNSAPNAKPPEPAMGWWERRRLWLQENKVFFDIAAALAIICTVYFAVINLKTMQQQIMMLDNQTKAMWYSLRPVLRVLPVNSIKDVVPFTNDNPGVMEYLNIKLADTTELYQLRLSVTNAGRSTIRIDSIEYCLPQCPIRNQPFTLHNGLILQPDDAVSVPSEVPFTKDVVSTPVVTIFYSWEGNPGQYMAESVTRRYEVSHNRARWTVWELTPNEFRKVLHPADFMPSDIP